MGVNLLQKSLFSQFLQTYEGKKTLMHPLLIDVKPLLIWINTCYFCRWYIMSPMKIRKRWFYNFYMKFMIWLDCTRGKFPIPRLREGEKGRGKFFYFLYKANVLQYFVLSKFSSVTKCLPCNPKDHGTKSPLSQNTFLLDKLCRKVILLLKSQITASKLI